MAMSGGSALALLAVGLFTGAMGSFVVMSTLQQRNEVPRGAMALMQYHMGQARKTARSTTCDGPTAHARTGRGLHADL